VEANEKKRGGVKPKREEGELVRHNPQNRGGKKKKQVGNTKVDPLWTRGGPTNKGRRPREK